MPRHNARQRLAPYPFVIHLSDACGAAQACAIALCRVRQDKGRVAGFVGAGFARWDACGLLPFPGALGGSNVVCSARFASARGAVFAADGDGLRTQRACLHDTCRHVCQSTMA